MSEEIVVDPARLRKFTEEVLQQVGIPRNDAVIGADVLIEADLRGVETHGVQLLQNYIERLQKGGFNPQPNIVTVQEGPAVAVLDGDAGMGHIVSVKAMNVALEKASSYGAGVVVVRNSNHNGMLAYYAMMALPRDMIGWTLMSGGRCIPPWGGMEPVTGNNPQAFAIPANEEWPIVLDMAHSAAAGGKIIMAARRGEKIPLEWGLDEHGHPTDDPNAVLRSKLYSPLGGVKGYCLAVVMAALAGVLSGGRFGKGFSLRRGPSEPAGTCHFFLVIDIGQFIPVDEFKERTDTLVRQVKSARLAPGFDRIYAPGEIEFLEKEKRLKEGIPIHVSVYRELEQAANDLGLELGL